MKYHGPELPHEGDAPPPDRIPFRGGLSPHGEYGEDRSNLMQAGVEKGYVIREVPRNPKEPLSVIEVAQTLDKHYAELRQFGIATPVDFVIGKNEVDQDTTFAVTKNVAGTQLKNFIDQQHSSDETQKILVMLETHFCNLIRYFNTKVDDGSEFLWDIGRTDQYVFGKLSDDQNEEQRIYLVDTDGRRDTKVAELTCDLAEMVEELLLLERSGKPLNTAKKELCDLLSKIASQYADKNVWFENKTLAVKCREYITKLTQGVPEEYYYRPEA